jgi:hypothetical protein
VTIASEPVERRIDLTALEREDQPTETGSSADNHA